MPKNNLCSPVAKVAEAFVVSENVTGLSDSILLAAIAGHIPTGGPITIDTVGHALENVFAGRFVYVGGNHVAVHLHSGHAQRLVMIHRAGGAKS